MIWASGIQRTGVVALKWTVYILSTICAAICLHLAALWFRADFRGTIAYIVPCVVFIAVFFYVRRRVKKHGITLKGTGHPEEMQFFREVFWLVCALSLGAGGLTLTVQLKFHDLSFSPFYLILLGLVGFFARHVVTKYSQPAT